MSATACGTLQGDLVGLFMVSSASESLVVHPCNDPRQFSGHFSTVHYNVLLAQLLLGYKGGAVAVQCRGSRPSLAHNVLPSLARDTNATPHKL